MIPLRFRIVYDQPGRLRVRCGPDVFSEEEGYGISSLLCQSPNIYSVETTSLNGGILIRYRLGFRDFVISQLHQLDRKSLPKGNPRPADLSLKTDQEFFQKLSGAICRRFLIRYFLPAPIRLALTIYRASKFIRAGLHALQKGRLSVAVLDAASITAAFIQRSPQTAASIMFLLGLSSMMEDYTRKRTRNALTQSLAVNIDRVWLVNGDTETSVPLSEVTIGNHIHIRTGGMIPTDGCVISGEAMVNEASMTGEPLPVLKHNGSTVYAGTVVEEGSLVLSVTALPDDSRIQKIVGLIDRSEALKANVQSRVEQMADKIVPFSFLTAAGIFLFTRNLTKALSVLMVDYSCALKLSTPISIISAMREAASHRVMVKGGKYLELFAQADTIIFDKTGTLTSACPQVNRILPFGTYSREDVLRISACLEEHFPHSVARAVIRKAEEEQLHHEEEHAEVEYVVAHGIASRIHGKRALIGSAHFIFEDEKVPLTSEERALIEKETQGVSAIYLAIGEHLAGVICIEDPVRPEAAKTIQELKAAGIQNIVMLTGDSEGAARKACRELGITEFRAQILPEEKSSIVEHWKAKGHTVIMVGDGINDSPALAAANVSVAMNDASDIAREVADITLLSNQLSDLITLRRLSAALFSRIEQNQRFILSFNTALLILGITGIISPSTSAFLHNFSTMGISGMSMRPLLGKEAP